MVMNIRPLPISRRLTASLRRLSTTPTPRATKYLFGNDDAWRFPSQNKNILGARSLIVTGADTYSQQLAQKMWFHLQSVGIQSTFFSVRNNVLDFKTLNEGLEVLKRAMPNSVITIGHGATKDCGAALRLAYEHGFPTANKLVFELSNLPMFGQISDLPRGRKLSLVSVADEITPLALTEQWRCLHQEENILLNFPGPMMDICVIDPKTVNSSSVYISDISLTVAVAHLMDTAFAYSYSQLVQGVAVDQIKEGFINEFNGIDMSNVKLDPELANPQAQLSIMVGRLRNNLIAHRGIDIRHSPFLFSTVADMKELQFLGQYKIMRPYSWSVVEVMSTFLEEALNELFENGDISKQNELTAAQAVKITLDLMDSCSALPLEDLVKLGHNSCHLIMDVCKKHSDRFLPSAKRRLATSSSSSSSLSSGQPMSAFSSQLADSLTPTALLEGLIMVEESSVDQMQRALPAPSDSDVNSSNSTCNDVMKAKLEFLRSDLMVDMMEKELKGDE